MALAEAPKGAAGNVTKRLQKELRTLMLSGGSGISAFPDGDNMFRWIGTIEGGKGTTRGRHTTHSQSTIGGGSTGVTFPIQIAESPDYGDLVYEGLRYKLSLTFPDHYPIEAMKVKFVTPCYHPNVDTQGNICLDILKEKWSALYDVRTVLLSIQSLLGEPNIDSPLNVHAADLWKNQENYKKALLDHYNREASRSVNDKGSVKYL